MLELYGYIGLGGILLAYILSASDVIDNKHYFYFFLNILGSGLLVYYAWLSNVLPFVILNAVWVIFSFYEVCKLVKDSQK